MRLLTNKNLFILLGLQLGLFVFFGLYTRTDTTHTKEAPLVTGEIQNTTKVVIEAHLEEKKEILTTTLLKNDSGWVIPEKFNFPASIKKVIGLFDVLSKTKVSWPSGLTKSAANELRTGENNFETKITFYKDKDVLKTIFLGTIPGLNQIYIRADDEEKTYTIAWPFDTTIGEPKGWFKNDFYALSSKLVDKVEMNNLVFIKGDTGLFEISNLKEGEQSDPEKVGSFVQTVLNIPFEDVLEAKAKEVENPALTIKVTTASKEEISYFISGPDESKHYTLKISKYPYLFKIRTHTAKTLIESKQEDFLLIKEKKKDEEPAEENSEK